MRIVAVDIGGTMIKSGLWNGETFVELRETETCASEGGSIPITILKRSGSALPGKGIRKMEEFFMRTAIFRDTQACR